MYSLSEFRKRLLIVKRLLTIYHGGFIMALLLASLATFGVHLLQSDIFLYYAGSFTITLIATIKFFDWLIDSHWLKKGLALLVNIVSASCYCIILTKSIMSHIFDIF